MWLINWNIEKAITEKVNAIVQTMNICWRRTRTWDTAVMHRETVDFGSPNVSPITFRKLPGAKKR